MRRVLYLVHGLPPEEYSGTTLVADGYAREVTSHDYEALVVHASDRITSWAAVQPSRAPADTYTRVAVPPTTWANWAVEAATAPSDPDGIPSRTFRRLLNEFKPHVIHVVDNVFLPLDWPEIAAESGVPVVRTVSCAEDLCGLIAPVSSQSGPRGYCEAPITPEHCATCVASEQTDLWGWPESNSQDRLAGSLLRARQRRLLSELRRKRKRASVQYSSVFDRIVFSNQGFREYFEQTLPLDDAKVRVVPMGMDLSGWPHRPKRPSGAPHDPVVFCLAGLFDPVKGHAVVCDAFTSPELLERDDYRLLLLGGGDRANVEPLVSANPNVSALGPYRSEELPDLLARVDVGVAPSRFETFHRVTREYLLAGAPVIANPTFATREILTDGVNGLLFDDADASTLSRALVRILEEEGLREKLTAGALATKVHSVKEEVLELVSIYEEVISGDQVFRELRAHR